MGPDAAAGPVCLLAGRYGPNTGKMVLFAANPKNRFPKNSEKFKIGQHWGLTAPETSWPGVSCLLMLIVCLFNTLFDPLCFS